VHAVKIKPLIEHYITKRSAIAEKVCHASVQSSVMQYCDDAVWFIGYHLEHEQEKPKKVNKGLFFCSSGDMLANSQAEKHKYRQTCSSQYSAPLHGMK